MSSVRTELRRVEILRPSAVNDDVVESEGQRHAAGACVEPCVAGDWHVYVRPQCLVGIDIDNASRKVQLQRLILTGMQGEIEKRAG